GTYKPGAPDPSVGNLIPSRALHVSVTNGGEPGMQRVWSPAALAGTVDLTNLFPFPTEYGVFTGKCEEANPIVYPGNGDYFPTYTGSVRTDPGGSHSVTVRQPPLNIRVKNRFGSYIDSTKAPAVSRQVRVFATMRTNAAECIEPTYELHTMGNPDAAGSAGWPSHTKLSAVTGLPEMWDPGLPFGIYDLCIDYQNSAGSSNWRRTYYSGYDNTKPLGEPTTLALPLNPGSDWSSSSSSNRCA
ncbi:MAG: hypothetical protein ACRDK0_09965, partial [Solirubrobacteraceae bacterium]